MMKHLLFLGAACLVTASLIAQNTINLSIEHYLQEEPLVFGESSMNNIRHEFDVNRLQYYVSEIFITDDQGMVISYDSIWTLVDGSEATDIDLGTGTMDSITSVTFYIGVDSAHNHLDPSSWPAEHPLAHKNPSMHWGWANGYRFNAMEGTCGDDLEQYYELHGLGDENYFGVTLPVSAVPQNGEIDITVYANYAEILRDMDLENGIISHGPIYEAQTSLENMRDYVFSSTIPVSTVQDPDSSVSVGGIKQNSVKLFPNPVSDGMLYIDRESANSNLRAVIYDLHGALVWEGLLSAGSTSIDLQSLPSGAYRLSLKEIDAPASAVQVFKILKL